MLNFFMRVRHAFFQCGHCDYCQAKLKLAEVVVDGEAKRLALVDQLYYAERQHARAVKEAERWQHLAYAMIINAGGVVMLSPAIVDMGINSTVVTKMVNDGVEYRVIPKRKAG